MLKKIIIPALFILLIAQISSAQSYFNVTEEGQIQLLLDLLRKGVQQEDTSKVLRALSPEVLMGNKGYNSSEVLVQALQAIFNKGSNRKMSLTRPDIPRADSRIALSDFWDFDILNPKIVLLGDSAIVECELVLWAGIDNNLTKGRGSRTNERLVFVSPRVVKEPPSSIEGLNAFESKSSRTNSSWKLAGFEGLLSFLEGSQTERIMGEKKEGKN